MNEHTPKNFALQLGALITLYVAMSSLIILLFGIINLSFPDALDDAWTHTDNQDSIRYAIASLLVFFPAYLYLTRVVNNTRRHESVIYHSLTRWLVYLSLVLGGMIILGSWVTLITAFLEGEITTRFVLKVLTMVTIIGAAFWYYKQDMQGVWAKKERQSLIIGGAVTLMVAAAVIGGAFVIDSPASVREQRLDQQQINDLQAYQWRIEDYYNANGALPESIATLYASERTTPTAPEGRTAYEYTVTGDTTYSLCATFAEPSMNDTYRGAAVSYPSEADLKGNYNWDHEAGEWCFERTAVSYSEKSIDTIE